MRNYLRDIREYDFKEFALKNQRSSRPKSYTPTRGKFAERTFKSKHQYRNALARAKGYKNYYQQRTDYQVVRSSRELSQLPFASRERRANALEIIQLMRSKNLSLSPAVDKFNQLHPDSRTTPETVLKYAQPAFEKRGRRWKTKRNDRLMRIMRFPTKRGAITMEVRDSRSASRIGEYFNALKHYLNTGEDSQLRKFNGKYVQSNNVRYFFLTDTDAINLLSEAGEFRLDSIYEILGSPGGG